MYFHQKYKLSNTNSSYQTTQWWNHAIRRRPAWVSNLELQPHQTPDPLWKTWTPPKTPDKEYRINWTQNNSDNSLTYVKTMKLHCHKQYNCTDLVCKSDEMMYWQKCKNPIFAQKIFVKITMHSTLHTSTKYTKTLVTTENCRHPAIRNAHPGLPVPGTGKIKTNNIEENTQICELYTK